MASPPPPGGPPSPLTVGRNFLKQYYHVLSTAPENIIKFYKPVSVLSHGEGSQPTTPASVESMGLANLLKDRLFSSTSFRLELENGAIDAQESVGGGVLLVVTGHMYLEETRKAFCHTFFLNVFSAPDSKKRQYYVHNDILRFLSEDSVDKPEQEEDHQDEYVPDEQDTTSVVKEPEEQEPATVQEDLPVPVEPIPVEAAEEETAPPPVETPEIEEPVEAVVEEPVEPLQSEPAVEETKDEEELPKEKSTRRKSKFKSGRKKSPSPPAAPKPGSWASLVASGGSQTNAHVLPPAPPTPTKTAPPKAKVLVEETSSKPTAAKDDAKGGSRKRDPDCTLVIKNVPPESKEAEVRALFEPFAQQTKTKITAINVSRTVAFVDYDSTAPVLLALQQQTPFTLHGKELLVEQKTAERRSNKGGRRSGSPGNQNNGFRRSSNTNTSNTTSGNTQRPRGGRGDRGGADRGGAERGGAGRGGRGGR